jgi:uncharacterized membrane protein YgcG
MKRQDAFMLAVTVFVFANCISYFIRSHAPYVTGWGTRPGVGGWCEAIGFPFVVYDWSIGGIVPYFRGSWVNLVGNLGVALAIGWLFAKYSAHRLPPLWPSASRVFQYSLIELLSVITVVGLVLGTAMLSRSWCLLVRNTVCLGGPFFAYGWSVYRRQASWIYLTIAALGLTLLTLTLDLHYQVPWIDRHAVLEAAPRLTEPQRWFESGDWPDDARQSLTRRPIGLTIIRATVPVLGLLSFLAIVSASYSLMRQYHAVWASRRANASCVYPFTDTYRHAYTRAAARGGSLGTARVRRAGCGGSVVAR